MQRLSSPFDGFRKLGRRDSTPPAPPIITQTAAPTFGPYTAGQTPAGVYTAGTYASTAGTISSATPQWTINGVSQPGSTVLIEGDVVGLSVLVTDSVANQRTFGYGAAAPAGAASVLYTARFGVGADNATGTGAFDTNLYPGTPPANGTYGNFSVTSGVITPNGSQTVGTYDVGGWPVQVISGYKAVANQAQFDALTPANSAAKTILVREAAGLTVLNTWNSGGDFNWATILGDGADPRPTTTAGLADTSNDSRKHFVAWATYNTKRLIFDNLRFVTGSTAGGKVNAINIVVSGGGNFCADIHVLRSYLSCSRPLPNGDYSGGASTFPGAAGVYFSGDVRRVSVRDNVISGAGVDPSAIYAASVTGWWEIVGNWVDLFYYDGIRPPSTPGLFGGNLVSRPMAIVTDTGAPHCDGTQFFGGQSTVEASAFIAGDSRGAWQSLYGGDSNQTHNVRNVLVSDNSLYQISFGKSSGGQPVGLSITNTTWLPKFGASFPLSNPQGGLRIRGSASGTNDLLNSVFRATSSVLDATPAITQTGNVDSQSWVEADWDTNYPNWEMADIPTLQNALQVHAAGVAAAAGKGANQNITSWGAERSSYVLNYTTPVVSNITLTPTSIGFTGTLRTSVGNNNAFWAVIPQADPDPTWREIKEQRVTNAVGYGVVWCNRASAGTDLAISLNTAAPSTAYKLCVVAENGWSVQSAITTANFTTLAARSPDVIFGANLRVWYDAEDAATLFQDSAGTTPVTAAGQSVGRWADKSGNSNHATQASSNKPIYQETTGIGRVQFTKASNHCLFTSAIDFTGSDECTIFALVYKASGVGTSVAAELSANAGTNNGAWFLVTDNDATQKWSALARGSNTANFSQASYSTQADPDHALLTITHDISGNLSTMRRNEVAAVNGTGSKGTGNFGNYALYLGRRGNASLPFDGYLQAFIVLDRVATSVEIVECEAWVSDRYGF
jgi:hypothetical protein